MNLEGPLVQSYYDKLARERGPMFADLAMSVARSQFHLARLADSPAKGMLADVISWQFTALCLGHRFSADEITKHTANILRIEKDD